MNNHDGDKRGKEQRSPVCQHELPVELIFGEDGQNVEGGKHRQR